MVRFSISAMRTGLVVGIMLLSAGPAYAAAATGFSPLDTAALMSEQVHHKAMLAVDRAGSRLVAVGEEGAVLLSDDNGNSWRQAQVPVSAALTELQFVDSKHGWAVGHYGLVLATDDGGETWHKQLDGIQAAQLVLDSEQQGGGGERALREAKRLVADGPDKPFMNLHFSDARNGFVFGAYNLIFRTRDGGQNWQPWLNRVDNPLGLHLYGMAQTSNLLMLAGEQGTLLRSTDGGEHFEALESPYDGSFFGVIAEPSGAFVIYGLRGHVFRSVDGGDSWDELNSGQEETISAATVLDDGRLLLTSQAGSLLVNRDAGEFKKLPDLPALPLAGVVQSSDVAVIVASLAGVQRFEQPDSAENESRSGVVKE